MYIETKAKIPKMFLVGREKLGNDKRGGRQAFGEIL